MQKDGYQLPMHRSRSVPVLYKEGVKQMDSLGSVYRVIPTTPKVTEQTSPASVTVPGETTGAGIYYVEELTKESFLVLLFITCQIHIEGIRIPTNL